MIFEKLEFALAARFRNGEEFKNNFEIVHVLHTHLHRWRSRIGGVGWGLLGNGLLPRHRPRIRTNLSLPRSMRSYRDTTCVWVMAYDLSPSDKRIINCEFKKRNVFVKIKMTRKENEKKRERKIKEITKDCLPLISDIVIPKNV